MVEIVAAQHFFSSVAASESPSGRRGYQTLFHTRNLPPDAIKAIEDRVQYNAPNDETKYQYYPLPGDLFGLSHIVPLHERDEFGRKGRYLAHTLILTAQNLAKLAYCPLSLLQQYSFATTLETVFAQADRATGQVRNVRVSVDQTWYREGWDALQSWPPAGWEALGLVAWNAASVAEHPQAIALLGPVQDRWATLAAVFLLAAARQRQVLSFDTLADGCRWTEPKAFRFIGFSAERKATTPARIYADRQTTAGIAFENPQTPYVKWMLTEGLGRLRQGHDISREQEWALTLQAILNGASVVGGNFDAQFLADFARLNSHSVIARWRAYLPQKLSKELMTLLSSRIHGDPGTCLQILVAGTDDTDLDILLFDTLLSLGGVPSRSDQRALKRWRHDHQTPRLDMLITLWTRDRRNWSEQISRLDAEDYQRLAKELCRWPMQPLPLWTLIVHPHVDLWIELIAPALPPKEWRKAMPILSDSGVEKINRLVTIADRLNAATKQEILTWLQRHRLVTPHLHDTLTLSSGPKQAQQRGFWRR